MRFISRVYQSGGRMVGGMSDKIIGHADDDSFLAKQARSIPAETWRKWTAPDEPIVSYDDMIKHLGFETHETGIVRLLKCGESIFYPRQDYYSVKALTDSIIEAHEYAAWETSMGEDL